MFHQCLAVNHIVILLGTGPGDLDGGNTWRLTSAREKKLGQLWQRWESCRI